MIETKLQITQTMIPAQDDFQFTDHHKLFHQIKPCSTDFSLFLIINMLLSNPKRAISFIFIAKFPDEVFEKPFIYGYWLLF
jgi:hypothetical protein